MKVAMTIIYSVIVISAAIAIYMLLGGRAIFGTREKPKKILGATIQIFSPDGLGPEPPELPKGTVQTYENDSYLIEFCEPYEIEGCKEHFVKIQARHVGYPISSMKTWRGIAVNSILESGRGFIALAKIV